MNTAFWSQSPRRPIGGRFLAGICSLVALTSALVLGPGLSQAQSPPTPAYDVEVFPFRITNPGRRPSVQPTVLTEWLLGDVEEADGVRWALTGMSPNAWAPRYRLEGSVGWGGQDIAGEQLMDCSFILTATESGQQVGKNINTNLTMEEAARSAVDLLLNVTGRLQVESNQVGADVYFDDQWVGVTPFDSTGVFYDRYEVTLKHPERIERTVVVVFTTEDRTSRVDLEMNPDVASRGGRGYGGKRPFPYSDAHVGISYSLGIPENDAFREIVDRTHTATLNLGLCRSYFRLDVAGYYGWAQYNDSSGTKDLTFLDAAGEEARISQVRRAGAQAELCVILPLSRTSSGSAHYPFAGLGYSFDNLLVQTEDPWQRSDGTMVEAGDTTSFRNHHPYWTLGAVFRNIKVQYRKSFDPELTGWSEFYIGIQASL